jgi:hypothetical protein
MVAPSSERVGFRLQSRGSRASSPASAARLNDVLFTSCADQQTMSAKVWMPGPSMETCGQLEAVVVS